MTSANSGRRLRCLIGCLLGLIILGLACGPKIRRGLLAALVVRSQTPSQDAVQELVENYPDPVPFLSRLWNTGKQAHRELAMQWLKRTRTPGRALDDNVQALFLAGVADPDASIRELALGGLAEAKSPLLESLAQNQLDNADPQIRLLGVQYLIRGPTGPCVPIMVRLLDDADWRVVATAETALRRWTGEDFGVRIAQAIPKRQDDGTETVDPAQIQAIRRGVERRKAWWAMHAKEYLPAMPVAVATANENLRASLPAEDFELPNLTGGTAKLSGFRGKVLILNFWATWCTACLAEFPDLIELQKRHPDRLVVIGISLDGAPDAHGHSDGHEDPAGSGTHREAHAQSKAPSLESIRPKVAQTVKTRGIPYEILLDPANSVGARFNGGELPTNVIIDQDGYIRRRFIGARALNVWEAMLAELSTSKQLTNAK